MIDYYRAMAYAAVVAVVLWLINQFVPEHSNGWWALLTAQGLAVGLVVICVARLLWSQVRNTE
jgi:hypothetical protein